MAFDPGRRTTGEWEVVIGAEVRAARIAADLDQAQLASRADVSLGAVKSLEGGGGRPSAPWSAWCARSGAASGWRRSPPRSP